jgi:hypothetical protein
MKTITQKTDHPRQNKSANKGLNCRDDSAIQVGIDNSPTIIAQRAHIEHSFGEALQRQTTEDEGDPIQGRFSPGLNVKLQKNPFPSPNRTGLPDELKSGIESLSGISMGDIHVQRNSSKPAGLDALAYTQGNQIHLGPGQERHLPHEAWHAVQQKQGRVKPTGSISGKLLNDNPQLEQEADRMGKKAQQMDIQVKDTVQILDHPAPLQRQIVLAQSDDKFGTGDKFPTHRVDIPDDWKFTSRAKSIFFSQKNAKEEYKYEDLDDMIARITISAFTKSMFRRVISRDAGFKFNVANQGATYDDAPVSNQSAAIEAPKMEFIGWINKGVNLRPSRYDKDERNITPSHRVGFTQTLDSDYEWVEYGTPPHDGFRKSANSSEKLRDTVEDTSIWTDEKDTIEISQDQTYPVNVKSSDAPHQNHRKVVEDQPLTKMGGTLEFTTALRWLPRGFNARQVVGRWRWDYIIERKQDSLIKKKSDSEQIQPPGKPHKAPSEDTLKELKHANSSFPGPGKWAVEE